MSSKYSSSSSSSSFAELGDWLVYTERLEDYDLFLFDLPCMFWVLFSWIFLSFCTNSYLDTYSSRSSSKRLSLLASFSWNKTLDKSYSWDSKEALLSLLSKMLLSNSSSSSSSSSPSSSSSSSSSISSEKYFFNYCASSSY